MKMYGKILNGMKSRKERTGEEKERAVNKKKELRSKWEEVQRRYKKKGDDGKEKV